MKTSLIVACLLASAATSGFAETYRTPATTDRSKPRERTAPLSREPVDGVIPRATRGGNLLQLINPRAPRKYGTSQEAVVFDPAPMNQVPGQNCQTDSGKWKGIKLFVFNF